MCPEGLLVEGLRPSLDGFPVYVCWKHALTQSNRVKAEEQAQLDKEPALVVEEEIPRPLIREKRLRQDSPSRETASLGAFNY